MRRKIILLSLLLVVILIIALYFLYPPQVIEVNPAHQSQDVPLNSSLVIKFDKPVKRQSLQHFITPQVYGEWRFEDHLIKNHLFKTLIFIPAVDFKPNTQYQVELKNIINPLGIGPANNFSFNFKTRSFARPNLNLNPKKITIIDIPLDWQDYPLSCEAACLKMALAGKGIYVSEQDIIKKIGYDQTPHHNNIWGNPYQAFVGDINGEICKSGYGVYWSPIAKAASHWIEAEDFSGWELKDLVREIEFGNPVMVWGTLPTETLTDCSWYTPDGKYIKAYRETHVRLVIGFMGSPENPSKIILNDPLAGRLYWPVSFFLKNWKVFGQSGVVIKKSIKSAKVYISSNLLEPGDTFLVKTGDELIDGKFGLRKINFLKREGEGSWLAISGIDTKQKPGKINLVINFPEGQKFKKEIEIIKREFPVTKLVITEELEEKGLTISKIKENIAKENLKLDQVFGIFTPTPYFNQFFIYPLKQIKIGGSFGNIRKSRNITLQHLGVDLGTKVGTPVYAINDGVVRLSQKLDNYGKTIVIDHGVGIFSLYLHLNKFKVFKGQKIKRGQIIALSGNTGYSIAPHLHFSVKINGASVDPLRFIETTKKGLGPL